MTWHAHEDGVSADKSSLACCRAFFVPSVAGLCLQKGVTGGRDDWSEIGLQNAKKRKLLNVWLKVPQSYCQTNSVTKDKQTRTPTAAMDRKFLIRVFRAKKS